ERFKKGEEAAKRKDYTEAIACFTEAIFWQPNNARYYRSRGTAHYNRDDFGGGIADFNEAIRLNTKDTDGYYGRALALFFGRGDRDSVLRDLNEAIRLEPLLADAYALRGMLYLMSKRYDLAKSDLTEAIRLDPNVAEAYMWRAMCEFACAC